MSCFLVGRRRGKRGQKSTHDVDIIIEKQYGTIVGEGNKTTAVWRIEGGWVDGRGEDRSVTLPIRLTSIDLGCQIPKLPHILHETSV